MVKCNKRNGIHGDSYDRKYINAKKTNFWTIILTATT